MQRFLEYWCDLSCMVRWCYWLALSLLMLAPAIYPLVSTSPDGIRRDFNMQWRRLMVLNTTPDVVAIPETVPFSPVTFQMAGSRLVSWLPNAKGGELVLECDWQNIPAIFPLLVRSGMTVQTFSVQPLANTLRFALLLEVDNDA